MISKTRKKATIAFSVTLIIILALFAVAIIKTNIYNNKVHKVAFENATLFSSENEKKDAVSVSATPRNSTWGKIFDFKNEGLTENNYQAYTYDFSISNNTKDEVEKFNFKLTFNQPVFLASAWNGSLEVHQKVTGGEVVAKIPDLREFKASDYALKTFEIDGESLIAMKKGDYLIYKPSSVANAMEVPIEPHEGTVPGFIMYVPMGESLKEASLTVNYTFHRLLSAEPLFWIAALCLLIWLIAIIIYVITSAQLKKYNERHKRDNIIINESIETFTGFIDAKDPYTNGHSKRVAIYTKRIAEEMGYTGEELERIYYIALLHDCGKIGVPDNILGKPGKLTNEEYEIIKSHTVRGAEILSSFKSLEDVEEGALYHHERYDGKGYPKGKAGEDIPLIGRMICVADSYDAMNTNRVYRNRLSKEGIIAEIESNKGKQFDPEIADIMLRLLRENKID